MKPSVIFVFLILWILGTSACLLSGSGPADGTVQLNVAETPTPLPSLTASPMPAVQATLAPAMAASPTITDTLNAPSAPTPTAPDLACMGQGGQIRRDFLLDERLPDPLEYLVYTPPCYQQQPEQRYPVLYLIHGQSFTHEQWDRLGADETADHLAGAGQAAPFIMVMPRDRLWTPPGEDLFGEVVVERLIPEIDGAYRTLPDRAYRAIGGLSRGAGWAVHLGLTHWDLFGAIGAHSPAVFWGDSSQMRTWLRAIPAEMLPRIYLDVGENDRPEIMESATWLESVLAEEGIAHEWHLFQGQHDEQYWQSHVEAYLLWYAAEW